MRFKRRATSQPRAKTAAGSGRCSAEPLVSSLRAPRRATKIPGRPSASRRCRLEIGIAALPFAKSLVGGWRLSPRGATYLSPGQRSCEKLIEEQEQLTQRAAKQTKEFSFALLCVSAPLREIVHFFTASTPWGWSFYIFHVAPAGVRVRSVCGKSETFNAAFPTGRKWRANFVKSFPTGRKLGKNSVDKTPGLWLSGGG